MLGNNKEDKFKKFLKQIFQFNKDKIDLNFGVYKVFKQKQEEICTFIENELSQVVNDALKKEIRTDNKEEIEKYRNIVFEHILNFFKRFYDKGDFYPVPIFYQGKEKKGAYCLDFNGEDVLFYWITKNQHYIKTVKHYSDYKFFIDKNTEIIFKINKDKIEDIKANQKDNRRFYLTGKIENKDKKIIVELSYRIKSEGNEKELNLENLYELLKSKVSNLNNTDLEFHINKFLNLRTSDFFIHKRLKDFLIRELNYYLKNEIVKFDDEKTLKEAKITKEVSNKIIEFLARMEDLQLLLWEKKKFAYDVNYVITLDKIKDLSLIKELEKSKKFEDQKKEWIKDLKIIDTLNTSLYETFKKYDEIKNLQVEKNWLTDKQKEKWESLLKNEKDTKETEEINDIKTIDEIFYTDYSFLKSIVERIAKNIDKNANELKEVLENYKKYKTLPIDTKYFKEVEYKLLEQFENLDEELDGILIKSDNWQALNTILPKYKDKIQTIYIDPPFNTGKDFLYKDNYKDATWLTLMESRLTLAKELLNEKGSLFLHLDDNANYYGRILLNNVFGEENYRNEIIWTYGGKGLTNVSKKFIPYYSTILFYSKDNGKLFLKNKIEGEITKSVLERFGKLMDKDGKITFVKLKENNEKSEYEKAVKRFIKEHNREPEDEDIAIDFYTKGTLLKDIWDDIGIVRNSNKYTEYMNFQTQKPEKLLKRVIQSASDKNNIILDFFLGSGTTTAVAHKLKRKWIGIDVEEHFNTIALPRMKKVLYGDNIGISKEVNFQGGGFFKYMQLEQYEDTLENVEFENIDELQEKQEEINKLKEYYPDLAEEGLLNLLSNFVIEKSKALLMTIDKQFLNNPFDFKLNINGEEKEINLIETFNLIKPINVKKIFERSFNGKRYVFIIGDEEVAIWREISNLPDKEERLIKKIKEEEEFIKQEIGEEFLNKSKEIHMNAINQYYPKTFLNGKAKDILTTLQHLLVKDFTGKTLTLGD